MGPRAQRPPRGPALPDDVPDDVPDGVPDDLPDGVPDDLPDDAPDDVAHLPHAARAEVHLPVAAEAAWALVTDVRNHARWIPLTRVEAAHPLAAGDTFVAVTGPSATRGGPTGLVNRSALVNRLALVNPLALVNRLALVDRMVVTRTQPPTTSPPHPGRAGYRKLGPVLLGAAEVVVTPRGPDACTVTWYEAVHLRGLPARIVAPVARPLTAAMLRRALRRLAAEVRAPAVRAAEVRAPAVRAADVPAADVPAAEDTR